MRNLVATIVLLGLGAPLQAAMPFSQGPKLVGIGFSDGQQGYSVAISADGDTAIVGAPNDDGGKGAAFVFTRSAGAWSQQRKLVGSDALGAAAQGRSVAISADGNTALVGGVSDLGGTGAVWVFARSDGVWSPQGKLVGNDSLGTSLQGTSVALSSSGNTAVVGGPGDDAGDGAVWIFVRVMGNWFQQGSKLTVGWAHLGVSVAVSADGNTAIFGGDNDSAGTGAAWVFTRSGSVWTQQGAKLVGTGAFGAAQQGHSVALSADGSTALVGGWHDDTSTGAAWVFTRSGHAWSQQGAKLVGGGTPGDTYQGYSVALSGDGDVALVGGWGDMAVDSYAWAFTRKMGVWAQLGDMLRQTGGVGHVFATAVALSGDGATGLVGGWTDHEMMGAAWVYTRDCRRGELNGDGALNVGDVFYLINYLFAGGPAPGCY